MAKKNSGFAGMNFQQIMMQQAFQSANSAVYCRFCGKDVKVPHMNSQKNWDENLQWEIKNQSHVSCAQKNIRSRGYKR